MFQREGGRFVKAFAISQIISIFFMCVSLSFFLSAIIPVSAQDSKSSVTNTPNPTGSASSNLGLSDEAVKAITQSGKDLSKVSLNSQTGEFLYDGKTTGIFNSKFSGLKEGTKTFDPVTGKLGKVGENGAVTPYDGPFGVAGGAGHLLNGFLWAAGVAGGIQLLGGLLGLEQGLTNALSISAGAGIFLWNALESLGPNGFGVAGVDNFFVSNAPWIGLGAAVVLFVLLYKTESAQRVNFQCLPWEAPVGGNNCEQCNGDPFRPCSEYRCKSLGQACEIVNSGTKDEKCVWVNPNDAASPTITPWAEVLTDNHRYTRHDTRPPSLGTKIVRTSTSNECLQAFTPLTFGITTNEPAQCKIDLDHTDTFDAMQFFIGNNNFYTYNHSQTFSLPSPSAVNAQAPALQNDGRYDFFVRCRDKNGNENVDEFAIQFCVDPSPDTTPTVIVDTSIASGSAVRAGVDSTPLEVYVNEPAQCKWSTQDKTYDTMENTMTCATSLTQINSRELYTCSTTLTGIADRQENTYYFRCKDQPLKPENERNVNVNSYVFKLRGSQPLNIIATAPNGTITGSTQTVGVDLRVTTDDGSDEGIAACSFSPTGLENSYVLMFETTSVEHTQHLTLGSGNYNYYFRCVDTGGNAVASQVAFTVQVDTTAPLISRAYHDSANNALKIVTNENAACVYSLNSCNYNFNEGIALLYVTPSNQRNHYAEWQPNLVYYLKCKDAFGNEPAPNACSLVASASAIA